MKEVLIHGGMKYRCEECGKEWFMCLEVGVEDFGKHGRSHQPCPFMIRCDCGGFAQDISGYIPLPSSNSLRPLLSGMRYFAYDHSGKDGACGKPSVYNGRPKNTNRRRAKMNTEQQVAFEWAKNQNFQSVAARYAKTLSTLIESLQAQLAASQRREKAAVEDIKRVPQVWPCYACKHTGQMSDRCHYDDRDCFEWRGAKGGAE